ncbi:GNAT family N-acetyltransferase [Accumulibacter sp.]|uniref:GNAT family N-acetyltransferase n=1 Tax=Accumulibacter sp. TaxID=2053492 RepID=UPI0025CE7F04|nr:GNAT family N-acetyltransferase [Accumulibacter sp.]MCM8593809.1 GNAT family N-acetyltransferase [Accumulibacter sp.]MCM8626149.1 GNAT family N-acetyltransferase [Accumulibacter sp.]MDS4047950.1 GNAT family N-acetyltransferase [Accumulibacter sp.]
MAVLISPVTPADVDAVVALARRIWQATYPEIISQQQIDYMLEQRYSPTHILDELATPRIWWDQAHADGVLSGFACSLITGNGEMKLDKVYVDPARQGLGIGRKLIEAVASRAVADGCAALILAVNKRNQRAIAAYHRLGFAVRDSVCVDIGGGFVMDDFIMVRSLIGRRAASR